MMMGVRGLYLRHRRQDHLVMSRVMMRGRNGNDGLVEAGRRPIAERERHARAEHADEVSEDEQPSRHHQHLPCQSQRHARPNHSDPPRNLMIKRGAAKRAGP